MVFIILHYWFLNKSFYWVKPWLSLPLTELYDFLYFFRSSVSFNETVFCVRPHSVFFLPLYTSLNWRQRSQVLTYCYLISFSLVNVLHNVMRWFSRGWSECIIHPHVCSGWTRIRMESFWMNERRWLKRKGEKGVKTWCWLSSSWVWKRENVITDKALPKCLSE